MMVNYISQNGKEILLDNEYLYYLGERYPLPKGCKRSTRNITTINDKVFINGYEFKDGKFKKTLKALFHKYF